MKTFMQWIETNGAGHTPGAYRPETKEHSLEEFDSPEIRKEHLPPDLQNWTIKQLDPHGFYDPEAVNWDEREKEDKPTTSGQPSEPESQVMTGILSSKKERLQTRKISYGGAPGEKETRESAVEMFFIALQMEYDKKRPSTALGAPMAPEFRPSQPLSGGMATPQPPVG